MNQFNVMKKLKKKETWEIFLITVSINPTGEDF